ncbi:ran-binding protein 3 [Biomphalaria glabrata]|uniref:Ran-binding protein 3-like n=1 Tax=Biomphalaria glabrata TaxID=6526 RepID=A0A2C9KMG4_BIOGL|nr:ran-binding protein 3-like [Biomphalaria glabrata]KAI8754527.1 ran-binding protein 3-like [Biomphalaria glabrata]KAI8773148.1 ran-binding protein 3 [Biomphalaria glabrata]
MADDAADSTKSEEDSLEVGASEYKVSSSFNNTQTVHSSDQDYSPASSQDNGQIVSSSDTREHPVLIQPSKMSGFWGHNPGMYSNPFVPRAPLKTDVVSTASSAGEERESIIAPGRLGAVVNREFGSGFSPSLCGVKGFQISPPVFSSHSQTNNIKAPLLKPAKLPDPTKINDSKADSAGEVEKDSAPVSERLVGAESEVSSSSSCSSPHAVPSETEGATAAEPSYNPEILANISKNNKLKDTSGGVSSSSQSDFVFGKNLSQRVTGVASPSLSQTTPPTFVFGENLTSKVILETNGSNESPQKEDSDSDSGKLNRTLEESAREYQAKHENKTELKEVERITGEEDESNVLQANAKLFLFDAPTQSWVERGRGIIRLNDRSSADTKAFQSRLVMRTQGSLRVVLNTKIWPGMTIERASVKSVRITAMDTDENIKVFLIMTNTKDSENILRAIDWRIQQLKIYEEPSRLHSEPRAGEKRKANSDFEYPNKTKKSGSPVLEHGAQTMKKDESDSSVQDPETEASCESHSSSLTIKSESD